MIIITSPEAWSIVAMDIWGIICAIVPYVICFGIGLYMGLAGKNPSKKEIERNENKIFEGKSYET